MSNLVALLVAISLVQVKPAAVDRVARNFMAENRLPGCAVIILKDGQPLYRAGYGSSAATGREDFTPATICPTASLDKTINGLAILRLIEEGKLRFDEPIISYLQRHGELKVKSLPDVREESVTVADCLRQESGFGDSFTLFPTLELQSKMAIDVSPSLGQMADYLLQKHSLDFEPRTKFVYSNFNFQLLDLAISAASGMPYEKAVQQLIFKPLGISDAKLFSSRLKERTTNEAICHDLPLRTGPSCLPENRGQEVPYSYGGIDYGPLHIWSLSATDLAKLFNGFPRMNGESGLLSESGKRLLFSLPKHDLGKDRAGNPANWYYSCGVWVNWTGPIANSLVYFAHSGNQSGSFAAVKGSWNGVTIVAVGNGNDERYDMGDRLIDALFKAL